MIGSILLPLWAVHIADGILTFPWLAGGFALAALLAGWGAWRIRDEEIPQVAVLTAAFFVASLIHVRVGPTSVHLLLNGLLGVVLGRRAALAIPVGLFLQAALFQHGGLTALGVNTCVMALPALLAWQLFALLQRLPWTRQPGFRAGLIALSVFVWLLSLVYSLALLLSNRSNSLDELQIGPANGFTFHPLTLVAALVVAVLAAWAGRRLDDTPEFPLGLLVGEVAILATMVLNCVALLWGGQEDWHTLALLTFVAHLPIAVVEGIVLGFTVSFLARVKPEMLLGKGSGLGARDSGLEAAEEGEATPTGSCLPQSRSPSPPALLLGLLAALVAAGPAHAHRLEAECRVLPGGKVQVESWFDLTGDSPRGAKVQVFRANGELVTEGRLDGKGLFVFSYLRVEPLKVVVSAGAGHRKELEIPATALAPTPAPDEKGPSVPTGMQELAPAPVPLADRSPRVSLKDLLTGIGLLLALAAFVLSVRNARQLRQWQQSYPRGDAARKA